ncbi:tRNA (adenosine(37)-N6)-threonylcarbamoyltransferase complex dimerization subunit type 1 TsaB [Pseudoduganella sp. DS3]|uniref:tRNA (Adenosine(37)-N6)-threonylcarbamoyltransferase complex dimerization subunit type 1 TsaB n=1 Tax=Pseudoduganella guangdongensis TaxID=2692179 RepID=A0A6N9HFJ1_9BURK|nr:tRNA (adenosine(37)-N6)-threonylcarbamoyltransferase complex dimerization subunit type 1 TsaB [Pseudoduganella guangdongensis]MYN02210.1 tRNA (adenosine(37)-N6)-threonylcarbamoyltransferase complex dimerization subunit type 1 TsaB [Pseudoduganella guangdongensis]
MATILAIETSSEMASCALLRGERVYFRESSGVRTHSQAVLPMIQELLEEAGIVLRDCDAIAYGAGPGSFTGVRTACGIAQGLGFGAGLPLLPIVTLDAMALAHLARHGDAAPAQVLAVLDARMNEVYWAQYRFDGGLPVAVLPAALSAPAGVAPSGPVRACGNGFPAYAEAFAGKAFAEGADAAIMPHAVQVAQLGRAAFAAGHAVPAAQAQPLYLRNKVAYTKAERAEMKASQA